MVLPSHFEAELAVGSLGTRLLPCLLGRGSCLWDQACLSAWDEALAFGIRLSLASSLRDQPQASAVGIEPEPVG